MASENAGRFVWYEHLTRDVPKAIAFYSEVVGWKTQPFGEGGDYTMWVGSQGPLGGVMQLPDEVAKNGVPPHWCAHVQVDDVDATLARTRSLGGKVHHEATDIPTVGRFGVIGDPQGAVTAVFTPAGPMTLHDPAKDGEFCWNELITSDSAAAFGFYTALFGWKLLDEMDMGPMGKYRIFGVGSERRLGGMMTAPQGSPMPPMWLYYASTSDLEAAMGRAVKAGGKVLNGPMDVPGGRIAQLLDPQGAAFALHQEAKK